MERVLLVDGCHGVHVPRNFYERFDFGSWNLNISDFSDLSSLDNEHYWEAWEEVLANAEHHDSEGNVWTLEQDGDLFAVKREVESA